MAIACTINAVTRNIQNISIEDILTQEINTCSFELPESLANRPLTSEEVIITKDGTKIFAGRVMAVTILKINGSNLLYQVECSDYTVDLDHHLVVETYENQTLYAIVSDINTNYLSGFTLNNVENTGPTIAKIQFNYLTPSEAFRQIAELIGYDWYVDYDKDIHFFAFETNLAPIDIEDNGEDFDDLALAYDKTQLRNRVYVRGGWYLSSRYTQLVEADGEQDEFVIKYRPYEIENVDDVAVDTGGGFVNKTYGFENVDAAGGQEFLINADEKVIRNDTLAKLNAGDILRIKYTYKIPVLTRVDDFDSQNAIAAIDGTDGVYEHRLVDENINDQEWAKDVGKAELRRYANTLVTGSFTTLLDGFASGQKLRINLTDRGIDEYYLIRRVVFSSLGGNQIQYTVEFATLLLGFTWLLLKILDTQNKVVLRDDEVLDQLVVIFEEATATETSITTTLAGPTVTWGADPNQGEWNASEWS